jgi:ubiquinone/menaquinone biosynthesis C-methylase UbiE
MDQGRFQLGGDAASAYEAQKVPTVFLPLTTLMLEHFEVRPGERVIDVACGTGIVARLVAPKVGAAGRVVGVDWSEPMLEIARAAADAPTDILEWRQADVTALPFERGTFDVAFCQQGLQFFPDKPAALAEIRRVLGDGGRLALSVWSEPSPLFVALAGVLAKYISDEVAARWLAPYSFRDGEVIGALVTEAGFSHVELRAVTIDRRIGPAEVSIPSEIAGNPAGADFARCDPDTRARIVAEAAANLAPYRTDAGFTMPQESHLFLARAS